MEAMLQVHEKARSELECVICLEVPSMPNAQIFSCLEDHLFCSVCKKRPLPSCAVCRQNFTENPPKRRRLAEKMIQQLN